MKVRMRVKLIFAALTVTGVLMAAPASDAQDPGGGPGMGQGFIAHRPPFERAFRFHGGRFWDNPRIAAVLKITPDQQKTMDGIWYTHRQKLIQLQADLQEAELGMEPLMNADQPNQAAIEAQIDKVVDARGALEKANSNFLLDLRMKLTPDQWKQIKNFRSEQGMHRMHQTWGAGGGQRMHMRGPGGPDTGPTPQGAPPPPSGSPDSGTGAAPPE